ncbi:hypothetical protein BATDEDRAFT_90374 [Batrachochytrium dendrobatidis JAM81]|uniref:rhomboid protease n=2 Tax=Batrachochytrium dendrobatidis TaxID=109871 RepID=F4P8H4_BATDJ|nr:uncharacterized protein BATDEDRAFT_90374 [Batrachochytrium dendrobatidis JAM81]EGF78434.1 hypothetical protein BATDEDRAFT_90374 [Batrachochytrium dendrobatidis JAM81]OAJ43429.1 hypothetical protein BDEG_26791 [Batrachochytrium dendrobatidis JEL423]|eukprot:XP_006680836.1 hypothetical protein BATDEDRAFT_90374 [Batrachochytrium dendrobatidis JAM81]
MADAQPQSPWTVGGTLKAIPLGTLIIIGVSLLLFIVNMLSGGAVTGAWCLVPTNYTYSPVVGLPRLFGYGLVHSGIVHFIVAMVAFPLATATLEFSIGTLPFLYLFSILGMLTGFLYCFVIWVFSFIWPSWGLYPVNGMDIPFFTFLTIETLSKRGIFKFASEAGVQLPEILFPLPFVVVFLIILPYSSWISHLCAMSIGILYFLGVFETIMITNARTHTLETSGMFAWFVSRPGFVSAPGAVALPLPGAYPDLMNPNEPLPSNSSNRGSIVTRIQNVFSASKYTPLGEGGGYQDALHHDVDPLLWDEEDDLEARGTDDLPYVASTSVQAALQQPQAASPIATNAKIPGAF